MRSLVTEKRKKQLRGRYLKAARYVDKRLASASCGLTLLRFISLEVDQACKEMEDIRSEVTAAMRMERGDQ